MIKNIANHEKKHSSVINTLYHISDIHIQNREDRHIEYKLVFDRLFDELKKDLKKDSNAIIVITGDIIHDKNRLSPSQIDLVNYFFMGLSNIAPVICIIGYHDVNINEDYMDSLTPLIKHLKSKNDIYLLSNGGIYEYNNILFGFTEMTSNELTIINDKKKVKIGLYHGIVGHPQLDNIDELRNSIFKVSDFENNYDLTLLGGIHKHQYLDNNKTICYGGSLLQTRHGESILDHGYVKFDIKTKKSEFYRIKNDYSLMDIKLSDIEDVNKLEMSLYPTIKLYYDDKDTIRMEDIKSKILEKNNNAKIIPIISLEDVMITQKVDKINNTAINEINNDDIALSLIMDEIKKNENYDEKTIDNIQKKIKSLSAKINYNYTEKKDFRLIKLKFNNMYIYKDGEIDISKFKHIVGMKDDIASGKSSLIAIIIYSIYGISIAINKNCHGALKVGKKQCSTEVEFKVDNVQYKIVRTRKLKTGDTNSTEEVHFYEFAGNEYNELLRGRKKDIDKKIYQVICPSEIMLRVFIMDQNSTHNFCLLGEMERYVLICKLFKIEIFDNILRSAESEIRLFKVKGENPKQNFNKDISNLTTKKEINEKLLLSEKENLEILENEYDKIKTNMCEYVLKKENCKDLKNVTKEIKTLKTKLYNRRNDLDKIKTNFNLNQDIKNKIKSSIANNKRRITILNNIVEQLNNKIEEINKNFKKVSLTKNIKDSYERYNNLLLEHAKDLEELEEYKESHKSLKNKAENLRSHEFNIKCNSCMKNPLTIEKITSEEKISELEEMITQKTNLIKKKSGIIQRYQRTVDKYNEITKQIDINNKGKEEIENIKKEILLHTKSIKLHENEIEKNKNILEEYKIKKSVEVMLITNDIDTYENELKKYNDNMDKFNEIIRLDAENKKNNEKCETIKDNITMSKEKQYVLIKEIAELEHKLTILTENKKEYEEMQNEINILNKIVNVLMGGGIVDNMINNKLIPMLEDLINKILEIMIDFKIKIRCNGKKIMIEKKYNDRLGISSFSGGEIFLVDISVRLALSQYNRCIKTNFFIMDESLSTCGEVNIRRAVHIFDFMKKYFDWILLISHDDRVINYYDMTLRIDKFEDGNRIIYK